ncbi:unnamed protein product, partial [Rotaria socialis]
PCNVPNNAPLPSIMINPNRESSASKACNAWNNFN